MTGDVCAVCDQPLGDTWPHWPHEPGCDERHTWIDVLCDCPTPAVHPECCPCTRDTVGIFDRIDRNRP